MSVLSVEEYETILKECAYKQFHECSDKELMVLAKEKSLCSHNIVRFLRWVKILVPPTRENEGGVVDFQMWQHVQMFIKALLSELLIVLLKSRQIGASWTIAVFCLWCALFKEGDTTLLFSKG
ncbi:unnamed protein product, partial [marine sediment metagenome]